MTSNKNLAAKLAEPLKSSAERSKEKGNTHPVKPEDRELTLSGNSIATDNLAAALADEKRAGERVKEIEEANKKQEEDPLYQRDLKVLEMSKAGNLPGQNIGKAATESEGDRASAELKSLEEFDERIKKGEKLSTEEDSKYKQLKERIQSRATPTKPVTNPETKK